MGFMKSCPGSDRIKQPHPEELRCSHCKTKLEIWSDETGTTCKKCNKEVTREMLPSCVDWCVMAKDCIGPVKYRKYMESKKKRKRK